MRKFWIFLIAFTFAFLAHGDSLPLKNHKEGKVSPVLPSGSIKDRPELAAEDSIQPGSIASGGKSPKRRLKNLESTKMLSGNKPPLLDGRTSSDSNKLLKSDNSGRSVSKKVSRLLKSRGSHFESSVLGSSRDSNHLVPEKNREAVKKPRKRKIGPISPVSEMSVSKNLKPKEKMKQEIDFAEPTVKPIFQILPSSDMTPYSEANELGSGEPKLVVPEVPHDIVMEPVGAQWSSPIPPEPHDDWSFEEAAANPDDNQDSAISPDSEYHEYEAVDHEESDDHTDDEFYTGDSAWDSGVPPDGENNSEEDNSDDLGVSDDHTGSGSHSDDTVWHSSIPEDGEDDSDEDDSGDREVSGDNADGERYEDDTETDFLTPVDGEDVLADENESGGNGVSDGNADSESHPGDNKWESSIAEEGENDSDEDDSGDIEVSDDNVDSESYLDDTGDDHIEEGLGSDDHEESESDSIDGESYEDDTDSDSTTLADGEAGPEQEESGDNDVSDGNTGGEFREKSRRNTKHGVQKGYQMPSSDIRWSDASMAHLRSRDGDGGHKKKAKSDKNGGDVSAQKSLTLPIVAFVVGGTVMILLMAAFFIYSWPIRRYYAYLCRRMDQENVESDWRGEGPSSIRVDPALYPSNVVSDTKHAPLPAAPQHTQRRTPSSKSSAARKMAKDRNAQDTQVESILDYTGGRSLIEVLSDDRKRDCRNAERRFIIKQQTSAKRNSLADSLMIAKTVIDDHARNKKFEEKASERRHKIKQRNKRRMSFLEEIQNACTVIRTKWEDDGRLEQSKTKRRKIKREIAGKRRPSLLDEIQVAKSVIMESPKKYVLRPGLIEEMITAGLDPNDYRSYYVMDYSKGPKNPAEKYKDASNGKGNRVIPICRELCPRNR